MNMKNLMPWKRNGEVAGRNGEMVPFLALHRSMNRLFDDFYRDFNAPLDQDGMMTNWPSLEVHEDDKQVKVVAELPGLDQKDIDLSLHDGVLTVKGEKKGETENAVYTERWHGQFSRSVNLGSEVDPDKVKASFDKGILTIVLEKRPEAQSRTKKIAINSA